MARGKMRPVHIHTAPARLKRLSQRKSKHGPYESGAAPPPPGAATLDNLLPPRLHASAGAWQG